MRKPDFACGTISGKSVAPGVPQTTLSITLRLGRQAESDQWVRFEAVVLGRVYWVDWGRRGR